MRFLRLTVLVMALACCSAAAPPYRFLLVAGNQWHDDASMLIDQNGEFQITAALLKSWGLPFDILRLDEQILDRYHLLDRDGSPRYGTIIWDADEIKDRNLTILEDLNKLGVSTVILGDTVRQPEIARLAGVRFISEYRGDDDAVFDKSHFITRALAGREKELLATIPYSYGAVKVMPERAKVIASRGKLPFATVLARSSTSNRQAQLRRFS